MSRLSLLLHESEVKLRMSVNNNDNLRVQWDLSGFYSVFDVYDHAWFLMITALEVRLLFAWEWQNSTVTVQRKRGQKSQNRSK